MPSFTWVAWADPPPRSFATFEAAKLVARDAIYSDHRIDYERLRDTRIEAAQGNWNPFVK
jgi:hypothetical protein